jgi:hypothetical protein
MTPEHLGSTYVHRPCISSFRFRYSPKRPPVASVWICELTAASVQVLYIWRVARVLKNVVSYE